MEYYMNKENTDKVFFELKYIGNINAGEVK